MFALSKDMISNGDLIVMLNSSATLKGHSFLFGSCLRAHDRQAHGTVKAGKSHGVMQVAESYKGVHARSETEREKLMEIMSSRLASGQSNEMSRLSGKSDK